MSTNEIVLFLYGTQRVVSWLCSKKNDISCLEGLEKYRHSFKQFIILLQLQPL